MSHLKFLVLLFDMERKMVANMDQAHFVMGSNSYYFNKYCFDLGGGAITLFFIDFTELFRMMTDYSKRIITLS